jgi:site-specific DNA recombinase
MKAILIARVSTEEQKEAGNSLPAQVARLEKYCQNKGFPILKSCSFDESAYTDDRQEFDRIIDFIVAQTEKVAVCCDKVDRLSRNIFDKRISLLYERALNDELELHFVSDGQVINSKISATEKFQFSISLGLAKYYSDAVSDNVKRALEQKLRRGEWPARAPFGYKNITSSDGKADIILDEHQAYIVRQLFELYASGAFSMQTLCNKLKSNYGITWSKGLLDHNLKNPFYYGVMVWHGTPYEHCYPTIISHELFCEVQRVKAGFSKKPFKYAGKPYIYRGLIRCGDCGLAITPEKHKGHTYYHCTQYRGKHGAPWFREEEITEQLSAIFKQLQIPEDMLHEMTKELTRLHQDKIVFQQKLFDDLTKEQKGLKKMMDTLYLDRLRGRITDNDYDRFYETLKDQTTDITIRLDQLQEAEDNYYITSKYLLDLASRAFELFMSSEVDEKRQIIKLVLSNLEVKGENIVWELHKPFDAMVNLGDRQIACAQ